MDIYRYKRVINPANQTIFYTIESNTGLKGVLVPSFGTSINSMGTILQQTDKDQLAC